MERLVLLLLLSSTPMGGWARDPPEATAPTAAATSSAVKTASSVSGFTVSEGLSKRAVKVADLSKTPSPSSVAGAASGKSLDPPPEFYRGPGSSSHRDPSASAHTITKPIIFPGDARHQHRHRHQHPGDGGAGAQDDHYLSAAYEDWKLQRLRPTGGRHPSVDRISVGHYGSPDHGHGGGGAGLGSYSGGYAYEGRPYATAGSAGGGHGLDYGTHASAGGGGGGGGHVVYYTSGGSGHGGGGGGGGVGGLTEAGGIPFDLYHGGHKGHYAGAGGEYSFTTYPGEGVGHEQGAVGVAAHKGHPDLSHKALLAKSFLIPLASAAVLGIAAALVSNPLLLQLGTVSGVGPAVVGKRRRRRRAAGDEGEEQEQEAEAEDLEELQALQALQALEEELETKRAEDAELDRPSSLAYRGQRRALA